MGNPDEEKVVLINSIKAAKLEALESIKAAKLEALESIQASKMGALKRIGTSLIRPGFVLIILLIVVFKVYPMLLDTLEKQKSPTDWLQVAVILVPQIILGICIALLITNRSDDA